jgi:hypothetical protein
MGPGLASAFSATVVLDGKTYRNVACVVSAEGPVTLADGRTILAQTVTAQIPKTLRPQRPEKGTEVKTGGRGFLVDSIGGDNSWETHWHIIGFRAPGADD